MSNDTPAIRSAHRDVAFPVIPEEAQAGMLGLLYQYEETERWPAEAVEAHQLRQLAALLAFADSAIPFWRDRLRRAGLRGGQKLSGPLFARLPVLSRAEAVAQAARLRPPALPPGHGQVLAAAAPPFVTSRVAQFFQSSLQLRHALWHGLALGEKLATLHPGPAGTPPAPPTSHRDWGEAFVAFVTGPAVSLDARHSPAEQLAWLARENPATLMTTSANALALAEAALAGHTPLPTGLRAIHTELGPDTEAARAACQRAFRVPLIAAFGTDATGLLAIPCPEHGNLHALSESARVEILNARNQPCAPGETGRLVATPLHNFAMPLFRLDTGADAEPGPPCPCGRTLPVLAHIRARPVPDA